MKYYFTRMNGEKNVSNAQIAQRNGKPVFVRISIIRREK